MEENKLETYLKEIDRNMKELRVEVALVNEGIYAMMRGLFDMEDISEEELEAFRDELSSELEVQGDG